MVYWAKYFYWSLKKNSAKTFFLRPCRRCCYELNNLFLRTPISIGNGTGPYLFRNFGIETCPGLRVTDLTPYALSCGVLLLWSALVCDFTLFVTLLAKRIICAPIHSFHKMQNAMLILSHDSQERIAQELLLRQIFSLSTYLSLALSLSALSALSVSRALSSLSLSHSTCGS